jgi:hypothetical protein
MLDSQSIPSITNLQRQINVGGSSRLEWFNQLATDPSLSSARNNLFSKISHTVVATNCIVVKGFTEDTRPILDKSHFKLVRSKIPTAPARYSPYHIALIKAAKLVPITEPPAYPRELRQVLTKRIKGTTVDKAATWVASHLCHNRKCINVEHIVWEPSWFNRLRDNCQGGNECIHRPHPCLQPHRHQDEVIDWTEYI